MGLLQINTAEVGRRRDLCARLVPPVVWSHLLEIDARGYIGGPQNPQAMGLICPPDRPALHIRVPAQRLRGDYAFSLDLEEFNAGRLEISFILANDLQSPRFHTDVDGHGRPTMLGSAARNLPEELRAMHAGLGPCQVRRGLGLFPTFLSRLEDFARDLRYDSIVLEPLTYHNAVMYEHHGFGYLAGRPRMVQINQEFRSGGALARLLDARSPFRTPPQADTARGRSWAIHDGILGDYDGERHLRLRMLKPIGRDAGQRTFGP